MQGCNTNSANTAHFKCIKVSMLRVLYQCNYNIQLLDWKLSFNSERKSVKKNEEFYNKHTHRNYGGNAQKLIIGYKTILCHTA